MTGVELVGSAAAALSMFSFAPQAVRVIRTNDTRAISLSTFIIVVVSTLLWLAYGIMLESAPLIVANVVNGAFACVILVRKIAAVLPRAATDQNGKIIS